MRNPLVLVVTPVFCSKENKRLSMLLQNIYWVGQQSLRDYLHVIVDDGSTDETPNLLDRFASIHDNLLVYHKRNGGSSEAINFGVEQSLKKVNPRFVTIIHSDDLLLPNSLESR